MRFNRKGISPVVGTILLVSVTVIVAGVIAAFAMGLGRPTAAPTVNLSLEGGGEASTPFSFTTEAGIRLKMHLATFRSCWMVKISLVSISRLQAEMGI